MTEEISEKCPRCNAESSNITAKSMTVCRLDTNRIICKCRCCNHEWEKPNKEI